MNSQNNRKVVQYVQLMTRGLLSEIEAFDSLLLWLGRNRDPARLPEVIDSLPIAKRSKFEERWQTVQSLGDRWHPMIIGESITNQEIQIIQNNLRSLRIIEH